MGYSACGGLKIAPNMVMLSGMEANVLLIRHGELTWNDIFTQLQTIVVHYGQTRKCAAVPFQKGVILLIGIAGVGGMTLYIYIHIYIYTYIHIHIYHIYIYTM